MSIITISPISTGIVALTQSSTTPTVITIDQGQQGPAGPGLIVDNYGDNRLITSDGTPNGVYAESDLTFDGILRVSGVSVSVTGHAHTSSDITNFDSSVSGLLPSISGAQYVVSLFNNNTYTISVTGLQPSGNYSLVGHTHSLSDISGISGSISSGVNDFLNNLSSISDACDIQYIIIQDSSNNTQLVDISNLPKALNVIDGGGVIYSGC